MNIIKVLFPFFRNIKVNKKIEKQILQIWNTHNRHDLYSEKYKNTNLSDLEKLYIDTFNIKKTLEDKSKMLTTGTGIYMTIFLGILTVVYTDSFEFIFSFFKNITAILSLYIIINLLTATIYSLFLLFEKNKMYKLNAEYYDCKSEKEKKDFMGQTIEANIRMNVIRNNYTSVANYASINYFLAMTLFLGLIFFNSFIASPKPTTSNYYKNKFEQMKTVSSDKDAEIRNLQVELKIKNERIDNYKQKIMEIEEILD